MGFLVVMCFIYVCCLEKSKSLDLKNNQFTYDRLYTEGIAAYDEAKWYQCSMYFEDALKDYTFYKNSVIDCRLSCSNEKDNNNTEAGFFDIMKNIMLNSECTRKCKQEVLGPKRVPGRSNDVIEKDFQNRKAYEYLQYCCYKLDRMLDAASAAYTFYVMNPDNKDAVRNVQFYREKMKVRDTDFIDLELRPYKEHYIRAMMAYEDELWEEVVEEIEAALKEFYKDEERCRAECEGPLFSTPQLDFYSTITEHYYSVINCQYDCEEKLASVFPEGIDDLLAEHYHYLQYSYYKLTQVDKASEAAASYLYIKPLDEVMLKNKVFFIKKGYEDSHTPRPEVVKYVFRRQELMKQVEYFKKYLLTTDYSAADYKEEYDDGVNTVYDGKYSTTRPDSHWMKRYEDIGLKIVVNGNHLNGSSRFATDGFLKDEQCSELKYMIEDYYTNEDGSRIISISDMFEKFGENKEELELSLRLLLRSSEISRHYMQKYHNLTDLYFKRTVITCWEITKESHYNRSCFPQEDGTCLEDVSTLPNSANKEYMSLMFLNDMKNADLYFLDQDKNKFRNVSSRCGRLVGFTTNDLHNVTIPTDDMRCAVVIKYTTNQKEEEQSYIQTQVALQLFEDEKRLIAEKTNVEIFQELKKNGTTVSMTSNELNNITAFVADGLAKNEECLVLQNLVKGSGGMGDGYKLEHPHTSHEIFVGLGLHRVTEKEAVMGDGYDYLSSKPSIISPHTEFETYIGLTVLRSASLAYHRKVNPEEVTLLLNLAEKSRFLVEKYFNLTRPLYFDFTHLVCRTAIEGDEERDDLSHPVHADNCVLQPDGICLKSFPAFTQRDYSAILYLNDEFEGGDFFFAHSNTTEKVSLKPSCGRLVGFDSKEYHGVKAVTKGQRCALALWFTLNPHYKELAHAQARKIIARLSETNLNMVPTKDINQNTEKATSDASSKESLENQSDSDREIPEIQINESDNEESESVINSDSDASDSSEMQSDSSEETLKSDSHEESPKSDSHEESLKSDSHEESLKSDSHEESLKSDSQTDLSPESKATDDSDNTQDYGLDDTKNIPAEPKIDIAIKVKKSEKLEEGESVLNEKRPKLDDEL